MVRGHIEQGIVYVFAHVCVYPGAPECKFGCEAK